MKTWIVAKKRIGRWASVYALTEKGQNVHLVQPDGSSLFLNTPFDVGQIWDLTFDFPTEFFSPYVENRTVTQQELLGQETQLRSVLEQRVFAKKGGPDQLLRGRLKTVIGHNGMFIARNAPLPPMSTEYWIPDVPLDKRMDKEERIYYRYYTPKKEVFINYTGLANAIDKIPEQTLLHVSLGTWWTPLNQQFAVRETSKVPDRCYLQISGWYT